MWLFNCIPNPLIHAANRNRTLSIIRICLIEAHSLAGLKKNIRFQWQHSLNLRFCCNKKQPEDLSGLKQWRLNQTTYLLKFGHGFALKGENTRSWESRVTRVISLIIPFSNTNSCGWVFFPFKWNVKTKSKSLYEGQNVL